MPILFLSVPYAYYSNTIKEPRILFSLLLGSYRLSLRLQANYSARRNEDHWDFRASLWFLLPDKTYAPRWHLISCLHPWVAGAATTSEVYRCAAGFCLMVFAMICASDERYVRDGTTEI